MDKPPMSDVTETPKAGALRHVPLIAILVVAVVGAFTLQDYLSFNALAEHREALIAFRNAHYLLTALGFMSVYILIVAFSLPGATIATLTGGFLFGVLPDALLNITGATIGATAIFLAARWGMGAKLAAKMDASAGIAGHLKDAIRENELSVLFLIRLVPAVPFVVANIIPALVGVSLSRFVFTTFFGIIPGGIVYTWVGAGLGEVFARGETPNLGIIFEPQILGPIIGLCALAALPIVIKAIRRKKDI